MGFVDVLLSLECSQRAETRRWAKDAGLPWPWPDDSESRDDRLTMFIPQLALDLLTEVCGRSGQNPIPGPGAPLHRHTRGFAWFMLSTVLCLWKRAAEEGVKLDLRKASYRAVTMLYVLCPEDVRVAEGLAVLTAFSHEFSASPEFMRYLPQLEDVVYLYVLAREGHVEAHRGTAVDSAASWLQGFLKIFENNA